MGKKRRKLHSLAEALRSLTHRFTAKPVVKRWYRSLRKAALETWLDEAVAYVESPGAHLDPAEGSEQKSKPKRPALMGF